MITTDSEWRQPDSLQAFGLALRARRESLDMTLDGLAAATGISKPYLSNIETARSPGPPSEEKARKIAAALGVEPELLVAGTDWLRAPASVRELVREGAGAPRRGDGSIDLDMIMPKRAKKVRQGAADGGVGLRQVPLINRVTAGAAGEFGDMSYPAGVADAYVPAPDLPEAPVGSAFALKVFGESMLPEYREGEIIIVGPAEGEVADGTDCVVRLGELDGFATTFKRVYFLRDGAGEATGVRLVPWNGAYETRTVGMEQVTGIYPVVYRVIPARAAAVVEERRSYTTPLSIEHD